MTYRTILSSALLASLFGAALLGACTTQTQSLNSPESGGAAGAPEGSGGDDPHAGTGTSGSEPTAGSSGDAGRTGGSGGTSGNAGGSNAGTDSGGSSVGGGTGATGGSAATGGSGEAGGAAGSQAGSAGSAGHPSVVACLTGDTTRETTDCKLGEFCVQSQSEACLEDAEGCPGLCARFVTPATCSGLGASVDCPEGYACLLDPGSASGTDPSGFCAGTAVECETTEDCPSGFVCLEQGGGRACSPDAVACTGNVTCPAKPVEECPPGFVRSVPDECYGPCVPVHRCACTEDSHCPRGTSSCDRVTGRCATPRAPAPRCLLPFDAGPCDAAIPAVAFIDGECRPTTYGGCEGNDNRFESFESCRAFCQGMPAETECPKGHVTKTICTACGAGGGCRSRVEVCAQPCTESTECDSPFFGCFDGVCQAGGCI
ncbi:MAG TPA: BPTI/Kunitz domain-containing protein [Polyangiaceae bacterium]